jgi:hypothetical protein
LSAASVGQIIAGASLFDWTPEQSIAEMDRNGIATVIHAAEQSRK